MDTIAINASEAHDEEGKKKFKVSDTAKAAMATGAAGAVAGAAGMYGADKLTADSEDETSATSGQANQESQQEEMTAEAKPVAEVTADVNPDDVMLEEPVAEPSTETDMVVEPEQPHSEELGYQPFAGNDQIGEDVLPEPEPEPEPEEVLIAENTETDVVVDADPTVDLICGIEEEAGLQEEEVLPEEDLYADNGIVCDETDIQSDLMA